MKQDRNGVRNAQDLERKYPLSSLLGLQKAVEQSETNLTKISNELTNFASETLGTLDNLQDQIDGNITTYYYSGEPTLKNLPTSEWAEDKYNIHLGDLYYDKDTGYAYRFYFDSTTNKYGWIKLTDSDVTKALALANSASDTADSKRRVFVEQPSPPYNNGDLWIRDEEIYVCQISKESEESFDENDFIIATKYTDDTVANQVGDELTVFKGTVTTSINEQEMQIKVVNEATTKLGNNLGTLEGIVRDMNFSFKTNGLAIATSNDPNNSLLDNTGIRVFNYAKLNAIFNYKGSGIDKLIVTGNAQIGYFRTIKSTKTYDLNGTQVTKKVNKHFYLKELIEDLEALEV